MPPFLCPVHFLCWPSSLAVDVLAPLTTTCEPHQMNALFDPRAYARTHWVHLYNKPPLNPLGCAGFLLAACLGTYTSLLCVDVNNSQALALSTAGALVGCLVELLSPKVQHDHNCAPKKLVVAQGFDNLTIPMAIYCCYYVMMPEFSGRYHWLVWLLHQRYLCHIHPVSQPGHVHWWTLTHTRVTRASLLLLSTGTILSNSRQVCKFPFCLQSLRLDIIVLLYSGLLLIRSTSPCNQHQLCRWCLPTLSL